MALVIIDQTAHRHAVDWYNSRHSSGLTEPGGNNISLSSDGVVPLRPITLEAVLMEIVRQATRGGDVILVCHARDMGLAFPLVSHGDVRARSAAIGLLSSDRPSTDGLAPAVQPEQAAAQLELSVDAVRQLRRLMNQVRAMRLRHVALRGCNVGSWLNTLATYKNFFGCVSLSGPSLRDTYGQLRPDARVRNLPQWMSAHHDWHSYVDGPTSNVVAIVTRGGQSEEHSYAIQMACQSAPALQSWGTRHLGGPVSNSFFYHGMFLTRAEPGSPRILFIGDAGYVNNLRVV